MPPGVVSLEPRPYRPAAHHLGAGQGTLGQGGHHVQIQGLADGGGVLTAVHDHHVLHRGGKGGHEAVGGEGAVEVDLHQADLLPLGVDVVHHFLRRVAHGAHGHHDGLGVGGRRSS